ncbi:hypothetical protein FDUTEX481_06812 [Tolypothrix sp. PCC 7601]|nr:hypothetical protein FDUTEX481_06812 [Tolypothrix sp. PCC 7601]
MKNYTFNVVAWQGLNVAIKINFIRISLLSSAVNFLQSNALF